MNKWPCYDCLYFDTFDSPEESESTCKIGRAVTHMDCEFQEPYSLDSCRDFV